MKKLLTLLGTAFLAFATLTACNSGGDSNDNGGDDDNKVQGESLPFSQTQASQKILELGATRGFEITYNTKIGDATGTETDTVTLGYKNDVLWIAGVFAYKKGPTGSIIAYPYDETTHQYSGGYDLASIGATVSSFDQMVVDVTAAFYYAYNPSGFTFTQKTTTTFLDRSAIQYTASFTGNGGTASYTVVVDADTGLTLKFEGSGSTIEGEFGFAEIVVTSIKLGDDVVIPTLVDDGQSGTGTGTGGNGQGTGNGEGSGNGQGSGEGSGNGQGETGGNGQGGTGESDDTTGGENGNGEGNNEDLSAYLVTEAQYRECVTNQKYIGADVNVTVNSAQKDNTVSSKPTIKSGVVKNANGTYSMDDTFVQNGNSSSVVYQPETGHEGYFFLYQLVNGEWQKREQSLILSPELVASDMGLDVASRIPFSILGEPAFVSSPCYSARSYTFVENPDDEYPNRITYETIRMYFQGGQLVKFSYICNGTIFEYEYSAFGTTRVVIPEVEDKTPVKHNEYIAGKQFSYSNTDKKGYPGALITDEELTTMGATVFKFFSDNKYERHITMENKLYVDIGTYELMVTPGENIAELKLRQTAEYFEGQETGEKNGGNRSLQFDITNNLVKAIHGVNYNGIHYDVEHVFAKENVTPTAYVPPVVASNWPAADIAQKLGKLGFTNVIPEINDSNKLSKAATVEIADGSLHITCEFASAGDALVANAGYYTTLTDGDYNLDWANCDIDNGLYAYLSKDNKMSLIVIYAEDSTIINIYAKKPIGAQYPTKAISDWLEENNVTDEIPEFSYSGASYAFTDGSLVVTLPSSVNLKTVISSFTAKLTTQLHFTEESVGLTKVYVGPNRTIGFAFFESETSIQVVFGNSSQLPSPTTTTYPSKEIGEFFEAKNITDTLPNLSAEGAEYAFYDEKDEGEWTDEIAFSLQLGEDANIDSIVNGFKTSLAGFIYDESEGYYVSPNRQFTVELFVDKSTSFIGVTIETYEKQSAYVTFNVEHHVEYGQRVYLVGDFCNWDPADKNAIALTCEENSDVWTAEVDSFFLYDTINCKFVVAAWENPNLESFAIWEDSSLDAKRTIFINNSNLVVGATWGTLR